MNVMAHRCAGGLKKNDDLRSGSQRHRHFVWLFKVPVQHRHLAILSVFPRLDPSMAQWDSNSQHKDGSFAVSLDNNQNHCANEVKTLNRLFRHASAHRGPTCILLNFRGPHGEPRLTDDAPIPNVLSISLTQSDLYESILIRNLC